MRHLIGAASAWGRNPERDALYLNVVPAKNGGTTAYKLVATAPAYRNGLCCR